MTTHIPTTGPDSRDGSLSPRDVDPASPTAADRVLGAAPRATDQPCSPQALRCLEDIERNVSQLRRELGARSPGDGSVLDPAQEGARSRTASIPGMTL